jgi:hypothetical protein
MPAASALRTEKVIAERSRGAHPCVAQAPRAQLASSSSRQGSHSARDPSRELSDEGLRLGAQGATHADGKGQKPQASRTWLVGWNGILARPISYLSIEQQGVTQNSLLPTWYTYSHTHIRDTNYPNTRRCSCTPPASVGWSPTRESGYLPKLNRLSEEGDEDPVARLREGVATYFRSGG